MKNVCIISLIFLLGLCLNNLYAQRPNTKKISIPYILQPVNPLNENIKYYSSSFVNNSTNYQSSGLSPKLKGFQLLNEGEVDLNIRFVINSSSFTSIVEKVNYKEKINDLLKKKINIFPILFFMVFSFVIGTNDYYLIY